MAPFKAGIWFLVLCVGRVLLVDSFTQQGRHVSRGEKPFVNTFHISDSDISSPTPDEAKDVKFTFPSVPEDEDICQDFDNSEGVFLHRSDHHKCGKCTCSCTKRGKINADCSSKEFHDIPQNLPETIWSLNMSSNFLTYFNTASVIGYRGLLSVNASMNPKLQRVNSDAAPNTTTSVTRLNLSFCNITIIDEGSFMTMPNLTKLWLNSNQIPRISNNSFQGLYHLKFLDLSNNSIEVIEYGAFDHLAHLDKLDLSLNPHFSYSEEHMPARLFEKLHRLSHLYIQGNHGNAEEYPNKALSELKGLSELQIDALDDEVILGPELSSLPLQHLKMGVDGGVCNLTYIRDTFFQHLPHLLSFELFHCNLTHIQPGAYKAMKEMELRTLSLTGMIRYDLFKVLNDLEYLQNSSLKTLRLVQLYYLQYQCRELNGSNSKYLQHIPLEELDLSFNRLVSFKQGFAEALPQTLKRLILRVNKFTLTPNILERLKDLHELELLDVSEQNINPYLPPVVNPTVPCIGSNDVSTCKMEEDLASNRHGNTDDAESGADHPHLQTEVKYLGEPWEYSPIVSQHSSRTDHLTAINKDKAMSPGSVSMPPKLRDLKAAEYNNFGEMIFLAFLDRNNSLKHLDLSGNFMARWGPGTLPMGVQDVNLTGNFCSDMNPSFFPADNSLLNLNLRNNFLGDVFSENKNGPFFAKLTQLKSLDISLNMIFRLPDNFFLGLNNIQAIRVHENKLIYFNSTVGHLKNLKVLDLSKNAITWISPRVRQELDDIASASGDLRVDLSFNPLPCTCNELDLLYWMANTKVYLLNEAYLSCRLDSGEVGDIGNIEERLRSLQRFCASKGIIICIVGATVIFFSFLIASAMMYRYRWKLRYLRNIAMVRLVGFKPRVNNEGSYKFDAYLLYTEDARNFVLKDCLRELEVKRGHKLCIEDRDFMPGTVIVSGIVGAVQNSSKTVPVVTPDFYDDNYQTEYGVKMAIMKELYKKRSVLHLCVYQPMSVDQMSSCEDLMMAMKRNSYTEVPPEEETTDEVLQHFWDELSQAIGHRASSQDQQDNVPSEASS